MAKRMREADSEGSEMKSLSIGVGTILIGLFIFGHVEVWGEEWKLFAIMTDGSQAYFDASNIIRPSRHIVRVWTKVIASSEMVKDAVEKFGPLLKDLNYSTELWEIDCVYKKHLLLQSAAYDNDGGTIMISRNEEGEKGWRFIIPNSRGDDLYKAVCK